MMRALRLLLVLAAMIAFLIGMVVHQANLRNHGREIILEMEPVDPRDLLLGYYVIIRTPIHDLDAAEIDGADGPWEQGDTVFVVLEAGDSGSWGPVEVRAERPSGGVFIEGRIRRVSPSRSLPATTSPRRLLVDYNLERYYAEQAEAQALEAMRQEGRMRLIVAVNDKGTALIKGLEIDGERRYQSLR